MTRVPKGFDRITVDPEILGGRPCVRGTRLAVQRVLEAAASCSSFDELRQDYPELEAEDLPQISAVAAAALSDRIVPLE